MKKCKWSLCPILTEQEQKDLIQVYEFIRIPQNAESLTEIRVFYDVGVEEFLRVRKFANGNIEWWKTSPFYDVEEVE